MKHLILSLFALVAFSGMAIAQDSGPVMSLESNTVDFGTIDQHSEPLRTVEYTNTGSEPLIIQSAKGSCGCTVPTWSKEPILPGETSTIEIRYATNRLGPINKRVTITTNEGGDAHVIKVVGKVLKKAEDQGVPQAAPSVLSPDGE